MIVVMLELYGLQYRLDLQRVLYGKATDIVVKEGGGVLLPLSTPESAG